MSATVDELLVLAKDPRYQKDPPGRFVHCMELADEGVKFRRMAWRLFRELNRPVPYSRLLELRRQNAGS